MAPILAAHPSTDAGRAPPRPSGLMLISRHRVAYAGPLGTPSQRTQGALTLYASLERPFHLALAGGSWERAELAVVPPFMPHRFSTDDRRVAVLQLEPETLDRARLPFLSCAGAMVHPSLLARIRDGFSRLLAPEQELDPAAVDVDELFFGQTLPRRPLDPRIATIVERMQRRPDAPLDAYTAAELTGLSRSRMLHLFKAELGTSFRCFRAWKRARGLLAHVSRKRNLSEFALELGYPDATHFSHSIRTFYGLTPRDIFAGSRHLAVVPQRDAA